MEDDLGSYHSPKIKPGEITEKGGSGVFACEPISTGELLVVWGGDVVTGERLASLPHDVKRHSIQVEDNLYQIPIRPAEPSYFVNHSCDPNAGMSGQIALIAMRDIKPGEEICFDYAMCDGSSYDEFTCECRTPFCRGRITASDWMIPELWSRYAGHFSPYLERRINRLRNGNGG